MKQYLFFTDEGFTYDPNNQELHSMQILGDGSGKNVIKDGMFYIFTAS